MRDDCRKSSAEELAARLDRADGARILALLRRLDQIDGDAPDARHAADRPTSPDEEPIGLWRPRLTIDRRVEYVRDERNAEAHIEGLWSTAAAIPPKTGLARVVWLGESVARGFFLDPDYAPAAVLGDLVNAAGGRPVVDVVDLARSGHSPRTLLEVMRQSARLSPDVFVVFAGNNLIVDAAPHAAGVLDGDADPRAANAAARAALADLAERFVDGIADTAHACGAPAILVIPEFNLADWESGVDRPPLVDPHANQRWRTWRAAASAALARNDRADAERAALAMCELDDGCSGTGLRIRARCRLDGGDVEEARRLFEAARDAELWKSLGHVAAGKPEMLLLGASRVVQDTLRRRAQERGVRLVDLPSRFADVLDGGIADRRLFLDQCHLTVEGIRVAVASIAEQLMPALGEPADPWPALRARCRPVDDAIVGRAHLEAAIYGACCGQRTELIRYHADRAASLAPTLAAAGREVAEFGTRGGVPLYSRAGDRIVTAGQVSTSRAMMLVGRMNVVLADVIAESFAAIDPTAADRVAAIRHDEYAVRPQPVDLLDPMFCTFDSVQPEGGWSARSAFYTAYGHDSRFVFVAGKRVGLQFAITARIRTGGGAIAIAINGATVAEPILGAEWTTVRFDGDARLIRRGINDVTIHWPAAACAADVNRRDGNRFYPMTGEIFRCTAAERSGTASQPGPAAARQPAAAR